MGKNLKQAAIQPSIDLLERGSRRGHDVLRQSLFSVLANHLTILVDLGRIKGDTRLNPVSDLTRRGIVGLKEIRVDLDAVNGTMR
jgi:hypothetical protein